MNPSICQLHPELELLSPDRRAEWSWMPDNCSLRNEVLYFENGSTVWTNSFILRAGTLSGPVHIDMLYQPFNISFFVVLWLFLANQLFWQTTDILLSDLRTINCVTCRLPASVSTCLLFSVCVADVLFVQQPKRREEILLHESRLWIHPLHQVQLKESLAL